jgi:hypothetical protein
VNSPRIGAEEMPQAQRRAAGDRALAIQNFGNAIGLYLY